MVTVVFSSPRRWLELFAAACLAVLLVACGGGGSASGPSPAAYDAGSPESQPWRTLFAAGSDTRTLTGTGCTVELEGVPESLAETYTMTFTLTRGTSGFSVSAAVGTLTFAQLTFNPQVTSTSPVVYALSVPGGTGTLVSLVAIDLELASAFALGSESPAGEQQLIFAALDVATDVTTIVRCASMATPLTKSSLYGFVPSTRIASFLAGTPTATVSSIDGAPEGCTLGGGGTYTYAISPQGQIQIDAAVLSANWLDTLDSSDGNYIELAFWLNSDFGSAIALSADSQGRGFNMLRQISASGESYFIHGCGAGEFGEFGGIFGFFGPIERN